jgi:hypothetical protein
MTSNSEKEKPQESHDSWGFGGANRAHVEPLRLFFADGIFGCIFYESKK